MQQLIQTGMKENIKAPHYWPLVRGVHNDGIPLTKGQQCEKCFCCITLPCFPQICWLVVNNKCVISFLAGELYNVFGSRAKYLDMRFYFVFSYPLVYQFVFLTQWGLVMNIIHAWTGSSVQTCYQLDSDMANINSSQTIFSHASLFSIVLYCDSNSTEDCSLGSKL